MCIRDRATRDENDKRIYRFVWDSQEDVTGYILRWGTQKEKLTHSFTRGLFRQRGPRAFHQAELRSRLV